VTATVNTTVSIGNDSAELLTGTAVGFISGSGGNDTIQGAINGVAPGSTIDGGIGDDSLYSRGIGDIVLGGAGDDDIRNDSGQAQLFGGAGNDDILSEDGQTTVYGGAGDDSLLFEDELNVGVGDAGNDTIIGLDNGDILVGGAGDDYIKAAPDGEDPSLLFGNEGDDTLLLGNTSSDSAFGGQGADYLFAGSNATADNQFLGGDKGADEIVYLGAGDGVVLNGDLNAAGQSAGTDSGDDVFTLGSGGATNLIITGNAGNDSISGTLGADAQVYMGQGDDYFNITTSGSSVISGDLGNDSGSIALGGNDTVFGDGAAQGSGATLGDDELVLTGSGGNVIFGDTAEGTDGGNDLIDVTGLGSGNLVYGGGGDDEIVSAGDNTLVGGAGNDIYSFGAGDVIPYDSLGINTYVAGTGVSLADVVTVNPGDSFTGGATFLIADSNNASQVKFLESGGVITGDEIDIINITNVDAKSSLNGGDDTFTGGVLAATGGVDAGSGNDLISFTGTSIGAGTVAGGAGDDLIDFSNAEAVVAANVTGGDGNDTMDVAGIFAGSFSGGAGNDVLSIGTLGAGASIDMGAGDERVVIDSVGSDTAGVASIFGGDGNDTISVGSGATGTSIDLVFDGGAGNDIIYGQAAGGDSISGGAGNDTLFGGGFGTGYDGTNASELLGDTLTGGAGKDVFIIGTSGKLGYIGTVGVEGTGNFGEPGWFFNGSTAESSSVGIFNGALNVDIITDFNPAEDTIAFNSDGFFTAGTLDAGQFVSGSIAYLADDLSISNGNNGYFGSTGGTDSKGPNNAFGLVGDADDANAPFGTFYSPFGTGYIQDVGQTSGLIGRFLVDTLQAGQTAFLGSVANVADSFTVTGGTVDAFFDFSLEGTAAGEIDGGVDFTYDTDNGALYYNEQLVAIFEGAPALTSKNFVGIDIDNVGGGVTPIDLSII
jgi:Ca2+-binding RTX toxin-like protein